MWCDWCRCRSEEGQEEDLRNKRTLEEYWSLTGKVLGKSGNPGTSLGEPTPLSSSRGNVPRKLGGA